MAENIRFITPAPLESRIPTAEAFGLIPQELRAFQSQVATSFSGIVSSGEYDQALERFRYAYEYRGKYSWNVESGRTIDRPDGLVQALDNVLVYSQMTFFGLAYDHRVKPVDEMFRVRAARGMQDAVQLNRGVVALASKFKDQGANLTEVDSTILTGSLVNAMVTYWDRTGFPEVVGVKN